MKKSKISILVLDSDRKFASPQRHTPEPRINNDFLTLISYRKTPVSIRRSTTPLRSMHSTEHTHANQVPKRINIPHTQSMSWLLETRICLSVRRKERKRSQTTCLKNPSEEAILILGKCYTFIFYFIFYFLNWRSNFFIEN